MAYPTHEQIIRRRRLAGLVILALLIWGIWSGISAIGSMFAGGATANPTATGVAAQGGEPCAPGAVEIKAIVGDGTSPAPSFSPDADVYYWYTATNVGSVACTFDVGSDVVFYKITSGSETIWDSRQCTAKRSSAVTTLQPGKTATAEPTKWPKVFSSESGCGAENNPVTAGGASYHIIAEVNKVISQDIQFVLN